MSTVLLVASVVLASVTYATVGAEPGQDLPAIVGSAVRIQVPPAPAPEKLLINETLSIEVVPSQPPPSMLVEIPNPQIICGMKVWRADPSIDVGIYKPLPEVAAGAKIRRIPATECVAGASTARREVLQSGAVYFDAVQLQPRPPIPADVRHGLALIPIVLGTAW